MSFSVDIVIYACKQCSSVNNRGYEMNERVMGGGSESAKRTTTSH